MPLYNNPFDTYQVLVYGGTNLRPSPPPPPPAHVIAMVRCYNGSIFAGQVVFYRDDQVQPNSSLLPATDAPSISMAISMLDGVLDLLRYSKPLYLFLDTTSGNGFIGTAGLVPVGEEEGK